MNGIVKKIVSILLLFVIAGLVYACIKSIMQPINFNKQKDYREAIGIQKMKEMGVQQKISAGESMRISYMYEMYLEKGVDIVQPSLGRMTRIDDLLKIRDMARAAGKEFQSGGRTAYNASFGCLYGENERIEFHAPISEPVHELMLNIPEIRDGKCFVRTDIPGIPVRMNLEKIEAMDALESRTIYLAPKA